jgi:alanyl-tRNA synthetase
VRSTGQIGGLLLRSVEKLSRGVRVEFVCGLRAVRAARRDAAILTETSGLLSIGAPELPAAVKRMLAEVRARDREIKRLNEELATQLAVKLIADEPLNNGLRLVVRGWNDRDRDFVRLLASRTVAAAPSTVVVFSARESDPARIFLARSPDLKFHCGSTLKEALSHIGLRGGGSPDLAQGDVPKEQAQALVKSVVDGIRSSVAPQKTD